MRVPNLPIGYAGDGVRTGIGITADEKTISHNVEVP